MTAEPPRFSYWSDRTDRRLRCPRGHEFTPELRLHAGHADVTCRYNGKGGGCGALLLVLVVPQYAKRLVAEVSKEDLEHMTNADMQPAAELAYLLSTPVRRTVASAP